MTTTLSLTITASIIAGIEALFLGICLSALREQGRTLRQFHDAYQARKLGVKQ